MSKGFDSTSVRDLGNIMEHTLSKLLECHLQREVLRLRVQHHFESAWWVCQKGKHVVHIAFFFENLITAPCPHLYS
jgi:hypothetical protein